MILETKNSISLQHNSNQIYMKRRLWIEEMEELEGNEHITKTYHLSIYNLNCTFNIEIIALGKYEIMVNHIMDLIYILQSDIVKAIIDEILNDMIINSMLRHNIMILEVDDCYICNMFEIKCINEALNYY